MKLGVKKLVGWFCIFSLVLLLAPVCNVKAAQNSQLKVSWLALGDSFTDPATYEGKDWTTYPAYIEEKLEGKSNVDIIVRNHAKGGFLAGDVINQIQTDSSVIANIQNADVVSVYIGGNDVIKAIVLSLMETGFDINTMQLNSKLNIYSKEYKAISSVLGDKNNNFHKAYISALDEKYKEIVATIKSYNPDCKIALSTYEYNIYTGIQCTSALCNTDTLSTILMADAIRKTTTEMTGYLKNIAAKDKNVYFVNSSVLFDTKYMQLADNGKIIDPHPNYAGQLKLADCFINDFVNKTDLSKSKGGFAEDDSVFELPKNYSFYAVNDKERSSANATMGATNYLSIDSNGIGAKLCGTKNTTSRVFEFECMPAKAAGTVTGISLWDVTNATEILLRFEGTKTSSIYVCAGGNGTYVGMSIALGFDASTMEHSYKIAFDNDYVVITVDGKTLGKLIVSSIASPVGEVNPILFMEKVSWAGTFANKTVTSTFSNVR